MRLSLLHLAGAACVAFALTGCGFTPSPVSSTGTLHMEGTVMGGQQPVSGAQVRLYVAGTGGNGTAASNLTGTGTLTATFVTTNALGGFSLAGEFTCPAVTSGYTPQVYLVAIGGNPGLNGNVNNTSLTMVDALGPCSQLGAQTHVTVNEVTTVAAAWALSGFMTSATNVASTSTNNAGLANAFLNAQLIADPSTGIAPGSAFNTAYTIESGKIYALADIIATCVNSDGVTVNSTTGYTPCQSLFNTTGQCTGSCTSDTLSAALYMVQHPAVNVPQDFALIPTNQPYPTTLTAAPHDWTLSMSISGGGLNIPTELALDSAGNVFVADYYGAVSAFSPQGVALSPSAGFGSGTLGSEIYGLAVDGSNNIWVDIEEAPSGGGSISGLYGVSSGNTLGSVISLNGSNYYASTAAIYFPESLATAQNGSIVIGNYGDSTTSVFSYTPANGLAFSLSNAAYPYSSEPTDVSGDPNGGVWLADEGARTVTHIDVSGNLISHASCCNGANGIATDKFGNAWAANYLNNSVSQIASGCDGSSSSSASCHNNQTSVILIGATSACAQAFPTDSSCGDVTGGLYTPSKVAIDAAQNVWVVNYHGKSFSEIAGAANTLPAGTGISPANTYNPDGSINVLGGYGQDAGLTGPFDIAPDASGNLWVSSEYTNTLVLFFGLAAPTATPKLPTPVTP